MNVPNGELWELPQIKAATGDGKSLMKVVQVRKASGLSDTSLLKLQAILSGEDHEWRIYAREAIGAKRWRLSLICKSETIKEIKHGGSVVSTDYGFAEVEIAATEDLAWTTVIVDKSETGKESREFGYSMMRPRAAVPRIAATA